MRTGHKLWRFEFLAIFNKIRSEQRNLERRSAGDCQNPHPSGPTHPRPAACPGAAIRSVPNNLRAKPVANAILRAARSEFERAARRRANRALPATAPPELAGAKPRFSLFSLNSFTIDTLGGSALYISVRKKGCLNFLYPSGDLMTSKELAGVRVAMAL